MARKKKVKGVKPVTRIAIVGTLKPSVVKLARDILQTHKFRFSFSC